MRDEFEARLWAEHGREWSDFVDRILSDLRRIAKAAVAIQFAAPWRAAAVRKAQPSD
jgi:hypothetical protein